MTPRRRAALDAIADTFVPGAVERGVTDAFVGLFLPRLPQRERSRLDALLGLFAARGFHRLSRPRRERVLLAWGDSRVALCRTAFEGSAGAVVCDGSTFPTASGVNPMVTISAVAHMNARALASRV